MSDEKPAGQLPWTMQLVGSTGAIVLTGFLGFIAWTGQSMVDRIDAVQHSIHQIEVRLATQEGLTSQLADHELRLRSLEGRPR